MIQRKQTLFLLLAVIAIAVCLFLPIASFSPKTMGRDTLLYNLGLAGGDNMGLVFSSTCLPLFLLLAVAACISAVGIFLYKNLNQQKSVCSVALLFVALWYVDYALMFFGVVQPVAEGITIQGNLSGSIHFRFAACLPLVSGILLWLAKKGVNDDIKLLKAADRIR